MAVIASVRHQDADYDELLMTGMPRADARHRIRHQVDDILRGWERG
jgi:hypothetical protein